MDFEGRLLSLFLENQFDCFCKDNSRLAAAIATGNSSYNSN